MSDTMNCPRCGGKKLWAIRRGKVRCGACRYEWIPGRLPLRLAQREWKKTIHWFLRGLPAQAIAQETGLERKRVIRALEKDSLFTWPNMCGVTIIVARASRCRRNVYLYNLKESAFSGSFGTLP